MNGVQIRSGRQYMLSRVDMPEQLFIKFSRLIYDESGIKLNGNKKVMLASRLSKRLRELGINNYEEYYEYVCDEGTGCNELYKMIDAVSTNKTEFFRENAHFELLSGKILPDIVRSPDFKSSDTIHIWSAGCSSGEEAYTIAIICKEFTGRAGGNFNIYATDISTRVLETAKKAVYQDAIIGSVPLFLRHKYFMKGVGEYEGYHCVVPELRKKVIVKKHNLVYEKFSGFPAMDAVFCRNVVIYFDRSTQIMLYEKLLGHLKPGGYLFIGHSETLTGIKKIVERIAPTVYRKPV